MKFCCYMLQYYNATMNKEQWQSVCFYISIITFFKLKVQLEKKFPHNHAPCPHTLISTEFHYVLYSV